MQIEEGRQLQGVIDVDEIYQTAGHKGRAPQGESRSLGRPPRRQGKKRGRGRGSAAKDAPALIGMVSRDTRASSNFDAIIVISTPMVISHLRFLPPPGPSIRLPGSRTSP